MGLLDTLALGHSLGGVSLGFKYLFICSSKLDKRIDWVLIDFQKLAFFALQFLTLHLLPY